MSMPLVERFTCAASLWLPRETDSLARLHRVRAAHRERYVHEIETMATPLSVQRECDAVDNLSAQTS